MSSHVHRVWRPSSSVVLLSGPGGCQYSAFLVTVSGCPGDTVMKLLLETDESVTGLSVRWSGNSQPSQSKGRVLVRSWGWL